MPAWAAGSWAPDAWAGTAWDETAPPVGAAWFTTAWASGAWASGAWTVDVGAPAIGTIVATATTLTIPYTGPVTHYRVYEIGTSAPALTAAPASPIVFTGSVNTEYQVEVSGDGSTVAASAQAGTLNPGEGGGGVADNITIAGQVGTATASGVPASIALRTGILAGVGVATASGLQASIAQGLVIAGGIGEAQASGLQAAISLGSNVTIAAGVGVAQALGLGAQIITSTNIAAAVGEAQASGLPASITVASGTTIAGGVGEAVASGLPAAITFPGPVTISCNVGAADAIGLRAIIRTLGLLPEYAAQPNTASSWSYKRTATLWSLVSRDEWGGQTTHAEPVLFRCDYATDSKRAVTAAGDEFTTRLLVYTSLPGVKQGDMLLIGATAERDPYQAGAHEVRAVTEFGDTFSASGPPDFRIAT